MRPSWNKRFGPALRSLQQAEAALLWAKRPTATAMEQTRAEIQRRWAMKQLKDRAGGLAAFYLKRRNIKALRELAGVLRGTVEGFYCYQAIEELKASGETASRV